MLSLSPYSSPAPSVFSNSGSVSYRFWRPLRANNARGSLPTVSKDRGEWELTRKQRIDTLFMDIERSKKDRDARLIEVKEARNRARQDVARMLEEQETEAQRVRLEIETRGRAALTEAENEATALRHLGQAHRDNRAVVRYELARRRVEVGEKLMQRAPRPVLIRGEGGEHSALSTLILARLLPQLTADGSTVEKASEAPRDHGDG
jgi:hypothetical protein